MAGRHDVGIHRAGALPQGGHPHALLSRAAYVTLTMALTLTLTKVGILAIGLTGVLTLFYRGLLELSKSFLDAFGPPPDPHTQCTPHAVHTSPRCAADPVHRVCRRPAHAGGAAGHRG